MDDEVYWYFLDGHLKRHLNPPSDPASVTFAHVKTTNINPDKINTEVTLCIEGVYKKPLFFTSSSYHTLKQFKDAIETHVKQSLIEHRGITGWTTKERKNNHKKPIIKRNRSNKK